MDSHLIGNLSNQISQNLMCTFFTAQEENACKIMVCTAVHIAKILSKSTESQQPRFHISDAEYTIIRNLASGGCCDFSGGWRDQKTLKRKISNDSKMHFLDNTK